MRQATPQRKRPARETVILFTIADVRFAIAANAVEEVCTLECLLPLASSSSRLGQAKVKYTLDRRHRRHFVVDGNLHFGILPSKQERVLVLRNCEAAVLVGNIESMEEISAVHALPHSFVGQERQWYRGLALLRDKVVPVVNPSAFLSKAEVILLAAQVTAHAAHIAAMEARA